MQKIPPRPTWLDPEEFEPPKGQKLLLLTKGGIATVGNWANDCKAWLPLPDTPRKLKRVGY